MQDILQELNQNVGILGSIVISTDGMVIAQALGPELDGDVLAAIASRVIMSTKRALSALGSEDLTKYIISSRHGRMMLIDIDIAYLVVVTNQNVDLSQTLVEIDSAAYKITHRRTD